MKTSAIRHRVADFLRQYPPFDEIAEDDLLKLVSTGRVHFLETDTYIFEQAQPRKNVIWVIQQGAVELWDESGPEPRQTDLLGAGDVLGVDRYLVDSTHLASARTASDVILYSIDAALFGEMMAQVPAVAAYVASHADVQARVSSLPTWVQATAPPLECLSPASDAGLPESSEGRACGEYFLEMLEAHATALRLTPGGNRLSLDLLALFAGQNPLRLAEEIRGAANAGRRSALLRLADRMTLAGLDPHHAARLSAPIATHLHLAFLQSVIREVESSFGGTTDVPHVWLCFGRVARFEMLPQRRARLGLLHEGDDADFRPMLDAVLNICVESGLPAPPDDEEILPSCGNVTAWREFFCGRVRDPIVNSLYAARMLFDMRPTAGDEALYLQLRRLIEVELAANDVWLPVLANDTLSRLPPLAFFGDLVVDLDGARRESLDLFAVAVQPIVDAARVLSLSQFALTPVRTIDRLEAARTTFPEADSIFRGAISAFEVALYYQARAKWRPSRQAAKVRPGDLSRYDQRILKTAFQSVQRLLEWTAARFVSGAFR